MKNCRFVILIGAVLISVTSCKIQDAPGAYAIAKGDAEKSKIVLKPELPADGEVAYPTPDPEVQQGATTGGKSQAVVDEPELVTKEQLEEAERQVPVFVVEEEPKVEVADDVEVTRKEAFTVVEGQERVDVLNYNVVVGSFGKLSNAQNLQSMLKEQTGANPILVQNEQKMYRVILETFKTYKEARAKINSILQQFPDAWVLVQK